MSKSKQFLRGMRDGVPILFGYIPVSIAFAIAARAAGFTALETQLMSLTVFTGASQMMAVGMWAESATIAAITVASLIVNLRYTIMSTCIMQRMRGGSLGFRSLLAFGVTDESFAVFTSAEESRCTPIYYGGIAIVGYLSWNFGTFVGALGADFLPAAVTAAFGIALHAMFTCIVAPNLKGNYRLALIVILAALTNTLLELAGLGTWSMVIATLLSAFVGVFFVELDDGTSDDSGADGKSCESEAANGAADALVDIEAVGCTVTGDEATNGAADALVGIEAVRCAAAGDEVELSDGEPASPVVGGGRDD